jgi:hypothetical protein
MAGALGASAAVASGIGAVLGGAIVGAATSASIQMVSNAMDGRALMEGVAMAALTGFLGGAAGGAMSLAVAGVQSTAIKFALETVADVVVDTAITVATEGFSWEGLAMSIASGIAVGGALNNLSNIPRVNAVQEGALNAGQTFGGGGRPPVNTAPVSTTMDTPPVQTPTTPPVGSAMDTPPVQAPATPPVGSAMDTPPVQAPATPPVGSAMDTPPVQTPATPPVGSAMDMPPVGNAVDTPPVQTPNTPPVGTPDTTPVPDDVQSGAWSAMHVNGTNSRVQVDYLPTPGAQAIEYFGNLLDIPPPTAMEKAAYARIRAWDQKNINRVAANAELNYDVVRTAHQHMLVNKHTLTIDDVQYEGYFSPSSGDIWDAAHRGALSPEQKLEFRNMIAHEWIEYQMEALWRATGRGSDYHRAFIVDTKYGGYRDTPLSPSNYAPHDIASHAWSGGFDHWNLFGRKYRGPLPDENLSNMDEVLQSILAEVQ